MVCRAPAEIAVGQRSQARVAAWSSFRLEIASRELGIRGTARLSNLAASPSEAEYTPLTSTI
jgi:hypothetical protein